MPKKISGAVNQEAYKSLLSLIGGQAHIVELVVHNAWLVASVATNNGGYTMRVKNG